jgi:NADH-quinone oxidoreductase subunit G
MPDTKPQTLVKLTVDGIEVEVPAGTPIIAAAEQAGVFIPHFCYHPDLTPAGNCRICQVDVEGAPRPMVSCMTPVKDGMVVRTDTERVKKAVQGDLEFLLLNHPVDCPICDQAGECSLQDFYMKVGLHQSRVPLVDKVRKRKVVALGPTIVLDSERCVMCSRCIRFSDEVSGTGQLGFFNRGAAMEIGTYRDRPLEDAYSGCYADVCPVGALTSAEFRFKSRVWFLQSTDSVCPECSTGCNIRIDHKQNTVYRFVPRRNPEVNKSWMCDQGRFSWKATMDGNRLDGARLRRQASAVGEATTLEQALERVAMEMGRVRRQGGSAAGLATPRASNEALFLFRKLMLELLSAGRLDYRVDPGCERTAEREDQVLRRSDHNPNSRGAELIGVRLDGPRDGVAGILKDAAEGRVDLLYVLGPELLTRWPDKQALGDALKKVRFSVIHDFEEREEHALFDVVLPVAAFTEMDATIVNFEPRLQRVRRAVAPPGEALADYQLLAALIGRLQEAGVPDTASGVFALLAAELPVFQGLSYGQLDPMGVLLDSSEVTPVP